MWMGILEGDEMDATTNLFKYDFPMEKDISMSFINLS